MNNLNFVKDGYPSLYDQAVSVDLFKERFIEETEHSAQVQKEFGTIFGREIIKAVTSPKAWPLWLIAVGAAMGVFKADTVQAQSLDHHGANHMPQLDNFDLGGFSAIDNHIVIPASTGNPNHESFIQLDSDPLSTPERHNRVVLGDNTKVFYGGGMGIVQSDGRNILIGGGTSLVENQDFLTNGFFTPLLGSQYVATEPIQGDDGVNGTRYTFTLQNESDWVVMRRVLMQSGQRTSIIPQNQLKRVAGFGGTGSVSFDVMNSGFDNSGMDVHTWGLSVDGKVIDIDNQHLDAVQIDNKAGGHNAMLATHEVNGVSVLVALPALDGAENPQMSSDGVWHAHVSGQEFTLDANGDWVLASPDLSFLPAGAEQGPDGTYVIHAPTGDVVVATTEDGAVTPETWLGYKLYATSAEALQNKMPVDLIMNGKAGDLCQLTAQPMPETVNTNYHIDLWKHDRDGINLRELRWGKDAQKSIDADPSSQPVRFCGYAATESNLDETQPDYIASVFQWKNPDGSYVYFTLIHNKRIFLADDIEGRDLFWPRFFAPDAVLNSVLESMKLESSIAKDTTRFELLTRWQETGYAPKELQGTALIGSSYGEGLNLE